MTNSESYPNQLQMQRTEVISPMIHGHKTPDLGHKKDPRDFDNQMINDLNRKMYSKDTADVENYNKLDLIHEREENHKGHLLSFQGSSGPLEESK